ncbi:sigma-70 family RNA polymerase sigma factor [Paenibacillus sp. 1011MAR3C5]|uniref:RNA polymerase sigma factor n=1 Tax=Paenibacillus sp. 1011MAR3C5 TaxID=1675787 RepID=UPI000E6B601D|nr:sigma-70 family RNA polymerase sigma factor [Paenibacillus sp. 1011MAR3C5]RJE85680.1 sigma-70 family RNA polymerase sigma factor [Paenibacillus sp. 1011MAR3C5]
MLKTIDQSFFYLHATGRPANRIVYNRGIIDIFSSLKIHIIKGFQMAGTGKAGGRMDEERQRIEQLKRGEESALSWLMERYGSDVLRTAALLLKDRYLAEDVSQETFLTAFRKADQYRGDGSLKGWLLRIAINLCRSRMRRASWQRLFLREWMDLDQDAADRSVWTHSEEPGSTGWMDRMTLREEIGRLPLLYREVIVLYYFHEMHTAEIAHVLQESEGTVKSKLHRARKKLKRQLEEGGWEYESSWGG